MPKLSNKAKSSKLTDTEEQSSDPIIGNAEYKEHPRSYRLDAQTMNVLQTTLNRVNESSPKKITEARLIRALIWLSQEIGDENLIKAAKEAW